MSKELASVGEVVENCPYDLKCHGFDSRCNLFWNLSDELYEFYVVVLDVVSQLSAFLERLRITVLVSLQIEL